MIRGEPHKRRLVRAAGTFYPEAEDRRNRVGVVVGYQEFSFRHVGFDMPIRHLTGNVRYAIGYTNRELVKVWDRDKISSVAI